MPTLSPEGAECTTAQRSAGGGSPIEIGERLPAR